MYRRFSDLCEKEVINCNDGTVVGNVTDIEISLEECKITALFIQCGKGLFAKNDEIRIPWEKIEKIGIDVIIINYCPIPIKESISEKCHKKLFFK